MKDKFLGIFLGFAGYTIFVFLDSIIKKYLVQDYPVLEINFYQVLEQTLKTSLK